MLTAKQIACVWVPCALMGWGVACAPRNAEERLGQARREALDGNARSAEERLKGLLAADPDDRLAAAAYNDLGVLRWGRGDVEGALEALDASRRRDPGFAAAAYNLGVISNQRGTPDEAAALFEKAAELDPSDPRPLEFLAGIEMQSDRWAAASAYLEKAAERAPDSPRVRTALALTRLRLDDTAGSVDHLMRAVEADSGYAPAYYNLAVIHDQWLQDPRTAARYLDGFLEHAEDPVRAREAGAMKAAWEAQAISAPLPPPPGAPQPSPPAPPPEMPPLEVGLADLISPDPTPAATNRRPAPPRDAAAEAPDPVAEPRSPPPTEAPPRTLPPRPAPVQRDRSVPIAPPPRPTTITGLVDLGRRLARQGRSEEAFRAYRDASDAAAREGQTERLELILREAVAACPSEPGAHYDYGLFLMNEGRPAEALPAFQQAVALAPNWVPPYLGMAETAVRTGQDDAAYVALTRALRLEPTNREAMWGIASLYDLQRRDPQEAVQGYRAFLSRYPTDSRADRARERIAALESQVPQQAPRQERITLFAPPRTEVGATPQPAVEPAPPRAGLPAQLPIRRPRTRNREAAVAAYNRGTVHQARDDWDRAIESYIEALESDDSFALAYYNLAVAYHTTGALNLARQAYEASIGLQPCHVNSRFNLALLLRELRLSQDAVDQLQAALRCDRTHARSHYVLGLIYAESSSTLDLAERHFRRFLSLAPNDPAAEQVRQRLQQPG